MNDLTNWYIAMISVQRDFVIMWRIKANIGLCSSLISYCVSLFYLNKNWDPSFLNYPRTTHETPVVH
jgi:hypothetical protein